MDERKKSDLYDVVIIGGGPAGLTAAIYLARARYRVLVMEKEQFGGQITITSEVVNYPGIPRTDGRALTGAMQKQAAGFGAEFLKATAEEILSEKVPEEALPDNSSNKQTSEIFKTKNETGRENLKLQNGVEDENLKLQTGAEGEILETVDGTGNHLWVIRTDRGEFRCFGLLAATGAHPRMIGFEGEEEFRGHGVAYCATCDGEFFTGKEIFVVGGGFAAAEESVFLTKYANHVTILVREPDFTCARATADAARQHDRITVLVNTEVEAVTGDTAATGIRYVNNVTGERTEYRAPEGDIIGVFVFAGYEPATELFQGKLALDAQGYIVTDREQKTSEEGIYAAGDVCVKNLRQVVTAVGDGAAAATELEKYAAKMQKQTGIVPERKEVSAREKSSQPEARNEGTKIYDTEKEKENRLGDYGQSGKNGADGLFDEDTLAQLADVFDRMERDLILEIHPDDRPISRELEEYMNILAAMTERLTVRRADDRKHDGNEERRAGGGKHDGNEERTAGGRKHDGNEERRADKWEDHGDKDFPDEPGVKREDSGVLNAGEKEEVSGENTLPFVKILGPDGTDTGLAFHGVPGGHEFTPFILSLFNAAGPGQKIDRELEERIAAIRRPVHMKIMVSLTCEVCPDLVAAAQRIAAGNPYVSAEVYDFAHFPQMSEKYHVLSVPCLIVNEDYVTFGKKTMKQLLDILETVG